MASLNYVSLALILIVTGLVNLSVSAQEGISDSDYPWTYTCVQDTMDGPACQRQEVEGPGQIKVPLKTCILTCGPYGALWPYPRKVSFGSSSLSNFSTENIILGEISIPDDNQVIRQMTNNAIDIFREYVKVKLPEDYEASANPGRVRMNIRINSVENRFRLETNESYSLTIAPYVDGNNVESANVIISAETFFGARHALESLAQLIEFNKEAKLYQIVQNVEIEDAPAFRYRGLLIDTARNFIPIKDLKRLVDALSHNKMSVLHWHLTDSNSYPFYSKRVPQMAVYGTFSQSKIYYPDQVREFLDYANQRGIKVIPELDAPAHAGNGWQFGEKEGLGVLSLCVNAEPYWDYCIQPPCGQLNPANQNMYNVLGDLYKDLLEVFDKDIFHMGGDEISFECWESSPEIQEWMETRNSTDLMDIWGFFQEEAHAKLKEAVPDVTPIVWTSEMTTRDEARAKYLSPDEYIIQIWTKSFDDIVAPIYNEKYRVIFSNNDTVYLDHGYGPWRGMRHAVTRRSWHELYGQDLIGQIERVSGKEVADDMYNSGRLLGGEATMFAEKVDALNMEGKIFPRVSAYAERLWSNPPIGVNSTRFAYPRLIHQRETMILRGIFPDTLLPESCYHTTGFCDRYD